MSASSASSSSAPSPPPASPHETRALLRAHLAAATGYRHLTRHCPICHRLLRLALEPSQRLPGEREALDVLLAPESAPPGRDEPAGSGERRTPEEGGEEHGAGPPGEHREHREHGEDESPPNA
ncbi:DUF6274 family protein [Streptomyces sp. NPDC047123]|uniref:DUF6274 family protein n=1 Tax=Streptomyces sp. NPDC047123 TaxID=3155622 RepID=UPI0033BFF3A3